MKLMTAKVIDGQLDLPEGTLEEGVTVTLLVPEHEGGFELTDEQQEELAQALAEADRGEGVDGQAVRQVLRLGDTVSPLARPEAQLSVAGLFPR